jgi:hypothetical protein
MGEARVAFGARTTRVVQNLEALPLALVGAVGLTSIVDRNAEACRDCSVPHAVSHQGEDAPLEIVQFRRKITDDRPVSGPESGLFGPRQPLRALGRPQDRPGVLGKNLSASSLVAV